MIDCALLDHAERPQNHDFLERSRTGIQDFPVNIGKGEQFKAEFLAVSPNNRIPAIVDHKPAGGGEPISVFESGAILLYLADKTGKFIGKDIRSRTETVQCCSGRWADLARWRARTITSAIMPWTRSSTRWIR